MSDTLPTASQSDQDSLTSLNFEDTRTDIDQDKLGVTRKSILKGGSSYYGGTAQRKDYFGNDISRDSRIHKVSFKFGDKDIREIGCCDSQKKYDLECGCRLF